VVLPLGQRLKKICLHPITITAGTVLLIGTIGGGIALWVWIDRQLAPLLQKELTKTLNRPVQVGELEGLSLNGKLRFGPSEIPATSTDSDRASVKAVEVTFNPLQLVWNRTLELDVALIEPDIYLEQDPDKRWVATKIQRQTGGGGFIKTDLQVIRAERGNLALVPLPKEGQPKLPVGLKQVNGNARLLEEGQLINFDLTGLPANGGNLKVKGEARPSTEEINVAVAGQKLPAPDIGRLIRLQGVSILAGQAEGNLTLQLRPKMPTLISGTTRLENSIFEIAEVPQLFTRSTGNLSFKGTEVGFEDVTTTYGQIPGRVSGTIDPKTGFNISARTSPVELPRALQTLNLKLPVAASGQLQADIRLTGDIEDPILLGTVVTTKPAKVDRLNFRSLRSNFQLIDNRLSITGFRAQPTLGGSIAGVGQVNLGRKPSTIFNLQAENLPGDALANLYGAKPPIKIGAVGGKAQVFGPEGNLQTAIQFSAPQATYPATGIVVVTPKNEIVFPEATLQVGSGVVKGQGQIANNRWLASLQTANVPGQSLAPLLDNKVPPIFQGLISGNFNLAGNLNTSGQSSLQATGAGQLQYSEGRVTASNLRIANDRWQGNFTANSLPISRLAPDIPSNFQGGTIAGNFNLSGKLTAFKPETLQGNGEGRIAFPNGAVQAANLQFNDGRWRGNFTTQRLPISRLADDVPANFGIGVIAGRFNLSGSLAKVNASNIQGSGAGVVNFPDGRIATNNLRLDSGNWRGNFGINQLAIARLAPETPANFKVGQISGNFNIAGNVESLTPENLTGIGTGVVSFPDGTINASTLQFNNGQWNGNFAIDRLKLARLAPETPPNFKPGLLSGNFNLAGTTESLAPENLRGNGSGRISFSDGTINASTLQFNNGQWNGNFAIDRLKLARLAPETPPNFKPGLLSGNFNLAGTTESLAPENLRGNGSGRISFSDGIINASTLQFNNGQWNGNFAIDRLKLARLAPETPPNFKPGLLTGNFNLAGTTESLTPEDLRGNGTGRISFTDGTINANALRFNNGQWNGNFAIDNLKVGRLAPETPPNFKPGLITGNFNLAGTTESLSPEDLRGSGSGTVSFTDGLIKASTLAFNNGKWQGDLAIDNLTIARLSPDLPPSVKDGKLTGNFDLSGSLASFKPETLEGQGKGTLNVLGGTIAASTLVFNNGRWQGNLTADNLNLENLAKLAPTNGDLPLKGNLNATVNAGGSLADFDPQTIQLAGNLRLEDLVIQNLAFDPVLQGQVKVAPKQGVNLQLAGVQDRIELALAPNYRPLSFLVKLDEASAVGKSQGDRLLVSTQNIPLNLLTSFAPLPEPIASRPIGGNLSGDFDINLANLNISGTNVAIAKPSIGTLVGDSLTGNFSYTGKTATFNDIAFQKGQSRYLLGGSVNLAGNDPQFQAKLEIPQGRIQDVLTALQISELADLTGGFGNRDPGSASDIPTITAGIPEASLLEQIRRLAEIEVGLQQQRQRRQTALIPELRDLSGNFSGEISVAGSLKQGINANFNLQGQEWKWQRYQADRIIAQGSFADGILTLLPLRISSNDSLFAFSGTIGGEEQSGQVQIQNLPAENITSFVNLPLDLTGKLNGTATLSGSITNPQARGEIDLARGTLNQTPLQSAQGSFNYADSRLDFSSTAIVTGTDPIQITGSFPYQLPFASVPPSSDQLTLDVNVANQGLALLNLVSSGQVNWVDGQGRVDLAVRGNIDRETGEIQQLVAQGVATVDGATISSQALQDAPLTEVTGKILFDLDRVQVESLQGKFSDGQILVAGSIPIFEPLATDNPLTVTLDRLALNIKGRYNGGANGKVTVTGSVLEPAIGGEIELANGQILLEEEAEASTAPEPVSVKDVRTKQAEAAQTEAEASRVGFNNLKLTLGRDVQITRPPILNFLATGDITINGTLDDIRPEGKVELKRGQVNLFTTQFRLDRGYPQTATFRSAGGLTPYLDVRLVATVPETTRSRVLNDPFLSAEISDAPTNYLGSLRTVRIQARVTGSADRLNENLELTSNPPRSETEIVALLGGGFVETLGRGETTLGLANLAGSALLGNIQNAIGDAIGLSEFRLFPTVVTSERRGSSTLGFGAEAGVDITDKLSASILTILNADQLPQYSIRYRVNDEVLLRGSTDFSGDTRAVVEYESRF
jgi:translocation and assembly module TamB